jgi:serine phosphatase RsbU (regulator of sigma subunit)
MNEWASPRRALLVIGRSLLIGALLGAVIRAAGVIPDLRTALAINMTFSGVMASAFELLAPWYHPPDSGTRSPGAVAAISLAKILTLYTVLVFVCVGLIRLTSGFDLMRFWQWFAFAYLFGLVITAFMNSLHTTSSMVTAERERARSEVDTLRLEMLEKDNARKTLELEEARALQVSMLPPEPPRRSDVAVAFGMRTATEVGGDYYDVRDGVDGGLELVLGDATGHGTKAGLLVVAAKTLFQTEGDAGSPASALARANVGVKSLRMSRMNIALTRVSVTKGAIRLSAAGMPPALHYRAATRTVHEVTSDAPPAGQLRMARYGDHDLAFTSGDRLVLFSDGFPECLDPNDDPLGYERAREALEAAAAGSPREIVEALFAAADSWAKGRPYEDDVSFLVIAAL